MTTPDTQYTIDLAAYVATLPAEDRAAAYDTHWFDPEYDRCASCDCRPWGSWAQLPCGTAYRNELPAHVAPYSTNSAAFMAGFAVHAALKGNG